MKHSQRFLAGPIIALCGVLISPVQSFGQLRPSPPSQLCVDDVCSGATQPTPSGRFVKWNPGNYIRADLQGFPSDQAGRFAVYNRVASEPLIKGALKIVNWGDVENQRGQYDFSGIDQERAHLAKMPTKKRLILEVWWHCFGGQLPTAPQRTDRRYLPDYVIQGGGAAAFTSNDGGYGARIHTKEWMDRLIALFQEMGRRYDGDPMIEQIVISETALSLRDSAFNQTALVEQFRRLVPAVKAAFPTTPVVLYLNYLGSPGDVANMVGYLHQNAVGVGGPDIIPPPPDGPYETWGDKATRGAGGEFGTTDYRGKIPVSFSFEIPQHGGVQLDANKLYEYAQRTLRATHVAWMHFDDKLPSQNWTTGVMPAIRARNGQLVTACPTVYQGACRSD